MKFSWVLFVAVLAGCGDDHPPPRCDDGARNGDETDVDCGGACFARCAINESCASDGDCMFGSCSAGVCQAPGDGPQPTGPVSQIIDPGGSTFEIVTDERVAIAFEFPAGAVREPTAITLTPVAPGRAWTNVDVEMMPAGQLLEQPATITLRLPAGLTFDPASVLAFGTEPRAFIAGGGQTGSELVVTTWLLGNPRRAGARGLLLPEDTTYWERMALQASRMPLDVIIPLLRGLVNDLLVEGRPEDALGVMTMINVVLQRTGDPRYAELATAALDEMSGLACEGVAARLEGLVTSDTPPPARLCSWQLERDFKPVYGTVAVAQLLGDAAGQPCTAAMNLSSVVQSELDKTSKYIQEETVRDQAARVEWRACECSNPVVEKRPPGCPMLARAAMTLPPDHWQIAVEVLERDQTIFNIVDAFASGEGAVLNTALTSANQTAFRDQAFAHCLDSRDMSPLGELAEVAPDRAELAEDGQRCAVAVTAELADSGGTAVDTAQTPTPVSGGGAPVLELGIARGHTVRVRGPVATLVCRDQGFAGDERLEADELGITAVLGPTTTAIDTLAANGSADLLSGTTPFEITVDDLLQRLGVQPTDPLPLRVELRFERLGPHCGDAYDSPSRELFRVVLSQEPIVHLKFDDSAGATAMDASGNGHHATLVGGASFGAGQCGGALSIGPSGQWAEVPHDDAFDLQGEYTISAWINYQDNDSFHSIAWTMNNADSSGWGFGVAENATATALRFAMFPPEASGDCNVAAPVSSLAGNWHHVAVAGQAGAPFTLYLDGVAQVSSSVGCTNPPNSMPLTIGGTTQTADAGTNGGIDDFRIYDRELTASEIAALASPTCGM